MTSVVDLDNQGSSKAFDKNWSQRPETHYNHWVKGAPKNQIQLAFRSHWRVFQELMAGMDAKTCLEVGAGRGSISSYFADHGFDCTLLDSSAVIMDVAAKIFEKNGHPAKCMVGNALDLPFASGSFDVVVSIGLLEHFEDIALPMREMDRILRPGGLFLGYVVPENPGNIQKYFRGFNSFLGLMAGFFKKSTKGAAAKEDVFRSDFKSGKYAEVIRTLNGSDIFVTGLYPVPMISHSPDFPFSLLPAPLEWCLTRIFEMVLWVRKILTGRNGWMCSEKMGQAFLVSYKKSA
jgi:ubiquinone/menaquinone biosynthesis C-methylase UbiE